MPFTTKRGGEFSTPFSLSGCVGTHAVADLCHN